MYLINEEKCVCGESFHYYLQYVCLPANDVLSSLMCVSGTYKIENNILTASADSGEKYVFEVVDDDTLRYVRKESNGIGYVEDGSSFILVTE